MIREMRIRIQGEARPITDFYTKELIKESPSGYAYFRIIWDEKRQPCDYEFMEVNAAFEKITGLEVSEIIGKKASEVLPGIRDGQFDWMPSFADMALNGCMKEYELYSKLLEKWYKVIVHSPKKGFFLTYFIETTKEKEQLSELEHFFEVNLDLLCIADTEGNFLKVNKEWENILGYAKKELERRKFLDFVHPDDVEATLEAMSLLNRQEQIFNFVNRYRCKDGTYRFIEWRAQPNKGHLIYAAARDITEKVLEQKALKRMVSFSEEFLQVYEKELDYQRITDNFLEICEGKFAAFNLYDEDGKQYTTMAVAGDRGAIKKAAKILGLEIENKKWTHDPVRDKKIKEKIITRFSSLKQLAGDVIPGTILSLISKAFSLGETIVIKILKNNIMLGDFTLIMPQGKNFTQDSIAEVYARQLGMVITQKRTEQKLIQSEASLKEAQSIARLGGWELNHLTGRLDWTDTIFEMFEIDKESFGASYQAFLDAIHPGDREKVNQAWLESLENKMPYEITHRLQMKDGRVKWVNEACKSVFNAQEKPVKSIGIVQDITERKKAELELQKSLGRFRSLVKHSPYSVCILDNDGRYIEVSDTTAQYIGLSPADIRGKTIAELFPPELADEFMKTIAMLQEKKQVIVRTEVLSVEGDERIFETWLFPIEERNDLIKLLGVVSIDITERKQSEDKIRQYQDIANNMQVGLHVYHLEDLNDDTTLRMIATNPAAALHTGLSQEAVLGKTIDELFPGLRQTKHPHRYAEVVRSGEPLEIEDIYYSDERIIEKAYAVKAFSLPNQCVGVLFENITGRKQAEEGIAYLSYHDQLTGLYNRRFFEEELKRLNTKRNLPLTIVIGDVNGLKLVNDSFGHSMGDELLRKTAEVIKQGCREDDIIARLGGDEFVMLLPRTDAAKAEKLIKRIINAAEKKKVGLINISISFGCATKSNEEDDIDESVKKAENSMYARKLYMSSSMRSKTIDLILRTLHEKNNREQLHSLRVSEICENIAVKMGLEEDEVSKVKIAALMHDIGKIGIGDKILNKPEKLSNADWEEIKRHSEIGYRILSSVNEFAEIADYVLEHHERWDGKGYPKGLEGEEISLQARIIAVADAFDAMTSYRPYRTALSEEEAITQIRRGAFTQFDPAVAMLFVEEVWRKREPFAKGTNQTMGSV